MYNKILILIFGFVAGAVMAIGIEAVVYKKTGDLKFIEEKVERIPAKIVKLFVKQKLLEQFQSATPITSGQSFGKDGWLTPELFRQGTFIINGVSGYAWQRSESYRDSAFIRTTQPLPPTYKIWTIVGDIDYGLEKITGLGLDPEYPEGPLNENGCYLLVITDELPQGHHTNTWWHQHRKIVLDVDNNVWGYGMPNPIFMVYFNRDNRLRAFNGQTEKWNKDWKEAVSYAPQRWYKLEVEKTTKEFIMSIYDREGRLLKRGRVPLNEVWSEGAGRDEYLVVGDPHENYYQGSFKVKEIGILY